ncbi:MAG: 50S ribosomal protein L5 [Patescibacteria group bacterium]
MSVTTSKQLHTDKKVRDFLEKVVINVGVGRLSSQPNFEEKILPQIAKDLSFMTGQKPETCVARKSIAGFKVREGQIVGVRITLRRQKMVDFFERLIRIVLPRVRDFSGLAIKSVDDHGVLNIGLKEQFVFPEINQEQSQLAFPFGINIVPKSKNRDLAIGTYRELGVPLKKKD